MIGRRLLETCWIFLKDKPSLFTERNFNMKILFISENYFPFLSGVPAVVKYLAEGLNKRHQVSVATTVGKNTSLPNNEIINDIEVWRFKLYLDCLKRVKGEVREFQKFVLRGDFDIIILECAQTPTTNALIPVASQIKTKLVLHAHGLSGLAVKPFERKTDLKHTIGNTFIWIKMQYYYGRTFKRFAKYLDATISLTDCDSGYVYLAKLVKKNYILCNAADDMFFEPAKETYQLPCGDRPYMVSIANYCVVKNQINMLRQFYLTKQQDHALIMIGSKKNDYYHQLEEENRFLSQKYGERPVYMLTGIERKYFPYILDKAKIYLVSSLHEEFSISIIEAMARKLPFISTDVGNARQLPGGIVCDNIREFSKKIDLLLSSESLRIQKGAEAQKYVYASCRQQAAINKLEAILKEVIHS